MWWFQCICDHSNPFFVFLLMLNLFPLVHSWTYARFLIMISCSFLFLLFLIFAILFTLMSLHSAFRSFISIRPNLYLRMLYSIFPPFLSCHQDAHIFHCHQVSSHFRQAFHVEAFHYNSLVELRKNCLLWYSCRIMQWSSFKVGFIFFGS